ncbi:MAG: radical SAM family heme chaperone HemW [Flavobacteriaceae bacterium]|nr:radical SAM family heme chaperone HemW [Flavobacteriaceae bacterium]
MAGIYLHIPFCKQACFYCDFHFSTSLKRKSEMIKAIATELILRKNELPKTIETIYFGGGTPSLLTIDEIQFLIDTIQQNFTVIDNPEITLEANPDDLLENQIIQLSKSPINRLSIGIQSFFEDDLKSMNRAHTAAESVNCLSVATRHFENITVDLVYGIPNMSVEKWKVNLQKVFDFGINHISSYALTVEPKTALDSFIKKGKYPPLDEQLAAQHFDILVEETAKNGFRHYEISNFGKPNYFSKHNTSYWQGKPYLGVGPSAHSFNGKQRSWNVSNNAKYIKSIQQEKLPNEVETLSINDRFNETIMTGLRTIWGVSLTQIEQDFGEKYKNHLLKSADKFIKQRLLFIEENTIRTTHKGKFLVDGIASELFTVD